jgi:hypothetical protein
MVVSYNHAFPKHPPVMAVVGTRVVVRGLVGGQGVINGQYCVGTWVKVVG